jgi:hypothetical protein
LSLCGQPILNRVAVISFVAPDFNPGNKRNKQISVWAMTFARMKIIIRMEWQKCSFIIQGFTQSETLNYPRQQ